MEEKSQGLLGSRHSSSPELGGHILTFQQEEGLASLFWAKTLAYVHRKDHRISFPEKNLVKYYKLCSALILLLDPGDTVFLGDSCFFLLGAQHLFLCS